MEFSLSLGSRFLFSVAAVAIALSATAQVPLGPDEEVVMLHVPYEVNACALCHETNDPANPGKIVVEVNDLCLMCHQLITEMVSSWDSVHKAAVDACTNCHNPHNASYQKLLHERPPSLCIECHKDIGKGVAVQHGALESEQSCLACHDPHASQVGQLLRERTFDLCVDCHGVDGVLDHDGKELPNISAMLDANPVHHGPVAQKDCSACHMPHGGDNFRLLVDPYPADFYAPFDVETYRLCFNCHDQAMVTEEKTLTLTDFRNGDRNLHFLHVNREKRGRTCRACHEIHAASQEQLIRLSVPYGSGGWSLPVIFEQSENGGSCSKTCHPARSYDRLAGSEVQ